MKLSTFYAIMFLLLSVLALVNVLMDEYARATFDLVLALACERASEREGA